MTARPDDELRAFLGSVVAAGRAPGAAWRVEAAGEVISAGTIGSACLAPQAEPAGAGTPWDLASLTKPLVTAPLLLLAAQEGRLDLDDPIGAHLPELARSPWADRTLLSLAAHTAGLPPWEPLYLCGAGLAASLAAIRELASRPAGGVCYSDLGYLLLGAALERAWGEALDDLFVRRLATPAGLARCGFVPRGGVWSDAAATEVGNGYERHMAGARGAGHTWREDLIRGVVHDGNAWNLGGVAGHAGLFGTAEDVAHLAAWLASPAGPLGAAARSAWLEPVTGTLVRTVGMVVAAGSDAARGVLPDAAPGHTGFTGCSVWLEPAAGRVYVLLTNRVHPRVPTEDFQPVRREFHRHARRLFEAAPPLAEV